MFDVSSFLIGEKVASGGGDIKTRVLNVTENGQYKAPSGYAYTPVNVAVPMPGDYSGPYTVTPTKQTQMLPTDGKLMTDDVTVNPIPTEYIVPSGTASISENGTVDVAQYKNANVNVPQIEVEALSVTKNGTYTPTIGKAYGPVTVDVPTEGDIETERLNVSENGTYTAPTGKAYTPVIVDVPDPDLSDATATPSDMLLGKSAYVESSGEITKISGTIPTKTQSDLTASGDTVSVPAGYYAGAVQKSVDSVSHPKPVISFDGATGEIAATHTQNSGYVQSGTTTEIEQLTVQAAQTITPGTANQTIQAGRYLTGAQTIQGDSRLVPENIKKDVTIFNVTGTLEGGTDTSDATATENDILSGKTAYVKDAKVIGNIPTKTASDMTVSGATVTAPAGYYAFPQSKSVQTTTHQAPTASINSSTGVVTASHTQTDGYVQAGTATGTLNLPTQAGRTITPGTIQQTAVSAGQYTTGAVLVSGDENLVSGNIKAGTSIFGVTGKSSVVDTDDANAVAKHILVDNSGYVNGTKLNGAMPNGEEINF